MSGEEIALHERIFAQVLGVEESDEFVEELTRYAAELIQILPPGWELVIGEGELAGIPMYVYSETQETEWSHPYESEYRRRIQSKRKELAGLASELVSLRQQSGEQSKENRLFASSSFNAETIVTDFPEDSAAFVDGNGVMELTRNVSGISGSSRGDAASDAELQDFEIVFAEVLGVQLGEKYYAQLSLLAKDLLKILPEGWELQHNDAGGVRVPYFFEIETGTSHWSHPFEAQFKEVIASKRMEFETADSSPRSPLQTARSRRSEVSVVSIATGASRASLDDGERQALIEAMFAGALGINPEEEFAAELGDYAKELLQTLPEGWEVVVADSGSSDDIFPLFVNTAVGSSQLDHPLLLEHTESIVDMRNALMYGVLPDEVTAESGAGASAEPSAEFLEQQRAEAAARSEAEERARAEREATAARELAEALAAEEAAETEAAETEAEAKRLAEAARQLQRQREEEERAAAEALLEKQSAEALLAEAERIAVEKAGAEKAEAALAEAKRVEAEKAEAKRAEAERAEAERAEAYRVEAERAEAEAEARQDREREAAERVAEEERRALEVVETHDLLQRLTQAEAEAVSVQPQAADPAPEPDDGMSDGSLSARLAESLHIGQGPDGSIPGSVETAHLQQSPLDVATVNPPEPERSGAVSPAQSIAEASVLSEGSVLTVGHHSVHGAHELPPLLVSTASLPHMGSSMLLVPSINQNCEAADHRGDGSVTGSVSGSPRPTLAPEPAPAQPTEPTSSQLQHSEVVVDSVGDSEQSPLTYTESEAEAATAHCAEVIVEESLVALAVAEASTALERQRYLHDEASPALSEAVATEVAREVALLLTKDTLAQMAKERAAAEREEEEKAAVERAERRAADKRAAEVAAEEARLRASEEEAALNAKAQSLFQQQLELARQSTVQRELTAGAAESEKAETTDQEGFSTEPESLSRTMRGDSAGVAVAALDVEEVEQILDSDPALEAQSVVPTPTAASARPAVFDLASVGSNAVRMKTQYLDLFGKPRNKDKRRMSKRASSPDAPEVLPTKLRDARASDTEGDRPVAGRESESSGAEDGALRPLSKVSPKKAALKKKRDSTAPLGSPPTRGSALSGTGTLSTTIQGQSPHKERLWEMRPEKDAAEQAVAKMRWYTLGCYKHYEEAIHSRRVICKMVVSDSQGTIIVDPRVDISDFDLVTAARAEEAQRGAVGAEGAASRPGTTAASGFAGLFSPPRAASASAVMGGSSSFSASQWTAARTGRPASPSRVGGSLPGTANGGVGNGLGRTLPAATDTRELIIGRVKRIREKSSKVRIRKDLSRMQWVVETDDHEVRKITDRHRKKTGVDLEGKSEDAVKVKARNALKAMQRAKEAEGDTLHHTLKALPPMEELVEADLMQVLSNSKTFGGFSQASQLVQNERRLKEELADRLGKLHKRGSTVNAATTATAQAGAGGGAGALAGRQTKVVTIGTSSSGAVGGGTRAISGRGAASAESGVGAGAGTGIGGWAGSNMLSGRASSSNSGSSQRARAPSVSTKDRLILPEIASAKASAALPQGQR